MKTYYDKFIYHKNTTPIMTPLKIRLIIRRTNYNKLDFQSAFEEAKDTVNEDENWGGRGVYYTMLSRYNLYVVQWKE